MNALQSASRDLVDSHFHYRWGDRNMVLSIPPHEDLERIKLANRKEEEYLWTTRNIPR